MHRDTDSNTNNDTDSNAGTTETPSPTATPTPQPTVQPSDIIQGSNEPRIFQPDYPLGTYSVDWPCKGETPFILNRSYLLMGHDIDHSEMRATGLLVIVSLRPGMTADLNDVSLEAVVDDEKLIFRSSELDIHTLENGNIWLMIENAFSTTITGVSSVKVQYHGTRLDAMPTAYAV